MLYRNIIVDTGQPFGPVFKAESLEQARVISLEMIKEAQRGVHEDLTFYTQKLDGEKWVTAIA